MLLALPQPWGLWHPNPTSSLYKTGWGYFLIGQNKARKANASQPRFRRNFVPTSLNPAAAELTWG